MKFPKELIDEAAQYLTKKTGKKPDKELTEEFLRDIAKLGKLFADNAKKIVEEQ